MDAKKVLKSALKNLKKEKNWILLESRYIQKLKYSIKAEDIGQVRRFERKAARSERRINQFEERLLSLIDSLVISFPSWAIALMDIKEKLRLYNRNILKRVSMIDGTIPRLLREGHISWDKINAEVNAVMEEGIRPLIILLDHLKNEFIRISAEQMPVEMSREELAIEANLGRQPFLIPFHSANEKEFANNLLFLRYNLPGYYMGRRIEYVFEVDFFWIKHHDKISGFFGHVLHGMTPRNAAKLLGMRHGETSAENILKRKGLLLPEWMMSRIGRIKLLVEIKSGWGSTTEALDELTLLVKKYHLENSIMFICFSSGVLKYLKAKLPNSFTITNMLDIPLLGTVNLPLNFTMEGWRSLNPFIAPGRLKGFVDCFITPAKDSEEAIKKQIQKVALGGFYFIGGRVKTKEKLDLLIKHGARGAFIWADAAKIIGWLSTPQIKH